MRSFTWFILLVLAPTVCFAHLEEAQLPLTSPAQRIAFAKLYLYKAKLKLDALPEFDGKHTMLSLLEGAFDEYSLGDSNKKAIAHLVYYMFYGAYSNLTFPEELEPELQSIWVDVEEIYHCWP